MVIGGGDVQQRMLIFRVGETITRARKVTHVIFDKTGHYTKASLLLFRDIYVRTKGKAAGMRSRLPRDKHPVSIAIAAHLSKSIVKPAPILSSHLSCKGVEGVLKTERKVAVVISLARRPGQPQIQGLLSRNLTVFLHKPQSTVIGAFGLQDTLRPTEGSCVSAWARGSRFPSSVVTGNAFVVLQSAQYPGHKHRFRAPSREEEIHEILQNPALVGDNTFIGDGDDDAPALARQILV